MSTIRDSSTKVTSEDKAPIIDAFVVLQEHVSEIINKHHRTFKAGLRGIKFALGLYNVLLALALLTIGAVVYIPSLNAWIQITLNQYAESSIIQLFINIQAITSSLLVVIWGAWIVLPLSRMARLRDNQPVWALVILCFGCPFLLLLPYVGFQTLVEAHQPMRHFVEFYLLTSMAIAVLFFMGWGLLWIISGGMPKLIFLLLTSINAHQLTRIVPRRERLAAEVIKELPAVCQAWTSEIYERVNAVSLWKMEIANGQVSSLSSLFGAVGLVSILSLVFTADAITHNLNKLFARYQEWLGLANQPSSISGTLLVVIMFVVIVLTGIVFFGSAYGTFYRLEMIGLVCNNQLARMTTAVSQPLRTANQSHRAVGDSHLGLLGWTVLIGVVVYRTASSAIKRIRTRP